MCGILGFTGAKAPEVLRSMAQSMVHRGPDEEGFYEQDFVSLGNRRLSIIDISSGQQPASNAAGEVWAVLNGEIYNHVELRTEMEQQGFRFKSHHSDTEVIPHMFEKFGSDFVKRLNGMFGIAVWDRRQSELHLFRDHCGIKPLFYTVANGRLIFGSEIKAILRHPDVKKAPNFRALYHYFTLKNIPAPMTAFEGIFQLRPGEHLTFKNGQIQRRYWWRLKFNENLKMSMQEGALELRRLLEDSVRLQLRSDAPFGAYLSGGIDSTGVVAIASRIVNKPLKTFTLVYSDEFNGKNMDRSFATQMAAALKTDHHEEVLRAKDVEQAVWKVVDAFDEPFSGTISTYFLTHLISRHVKVALSGDGADELFGSYLNHRLAQPLADGKTTDPELARLLNLPDEAARRVEQYVFNEDDKQRLLTPAFLDLADDADTEDLLRALYHQAGTQDPLNRALYADFYSLLPDQVLAFVDRLSMQHSVEVRPPFLDPRIVEFAATVPGLMKITREGATKAILKEALKDLLPSDLLHRPKEGFVMPTHIWITNQLRSLTQDLLSEAALKKHGLINPSVVNQLVSDPTKIVGRQAYKVWNLMMFQIWWKQHFN